MNELETKLTLWAICSVILIEILFIIFLFRFYLNRARPKKLYLKREEYECLPSRNSNSQGKFQSTILRPPHADELALVGTIRGPHSVVTYQNGIENLGFYANDDGKKMPPVPSSSSSSSASSQHWIDLQSPIINTANLSPADYEIHSYPMDQYIHRHPHLPRATIIDLPQYHQDYKNYDYDDDHHIENYRFQTFRRSDVILPAVTRTDTSTEFYGMNYPNVVPKSILKSSTSITPPADFLSSPCVTTTQRTQSSSQTYDQSPDISVKFTTQKTIPIYYPTNVNEEDETYIEPVRPLTSKYQMKFANVSRLNDIQWEVPREFKTIIQDNNTDDSYLEPRRSSNMFDPRIILTHQREIKIPRPHYPTNYDTTEQKAFEY